MTAIRKVLVVDDDPVVGKSFDRVLSSRGYAVITAVNGEEAMTKLGNEAYDVVFADIRMPGMGGLEVAERIKATQPWLPVVIVTGYATEASEARARAAGVHDFLRKPLSPEMIAGSAEAATEESIAPAAPAGVALLLEAPATAPPSAEPLGGLALAAKNVALFLAAPFMGLAYVVVFPFVGRGMLAWIGGRALLSHRKEA